MNIESSPNQPRLVFLERVRIKFGFIILCLGAVPVAGDGGWTGNLAKRFTAEQISAVNAALRKVAVALLDDHLRHCVRDAASDDARSEAIVTEATEAIDRLLKS